eukprot:365203-Chlamydomonas_euryale.AAC.17
MPPMNKNAAHGALRILCGLHDHLSVRSTGGRPLCKGRRCDTCGLLWPALHRTPSKSSATRGHRLDTPICAPGSIAAAKATPAALGAVRAT